MSRPRQTIRVVPIETLTAHPGNIREDLGDLTELARSIIEHGILQPLVVTELNGHHDRYLLLAGHRRLAAACLAKLTSVPVVIRHGITGEVEQIAVMLVENGHRKDLAPVDKAQAFGALKNHGLSLTEIARITGFHTSTVSWYLNLLDLDEENLEHVRTGELPAGDAIRAVREENQKRREANGQALRGRPQFVDRRAYFSRSHPLADQVQSLCAHTTVIKVGGVGCGPCWERVIRLDATGGGPSMPAPPDGRVAKPYRPQPPKPIDEIAVQRVMDGDWKLKLNKSEKIELVRRWEAAGRSLNELERLTGLKSDRYTADARAAS